MENYILLKNLPDAEKGTKVTWEENANAFYYIKSSYVSPHNKNYLTAGTVTQSPEWFTVEKNKEIIDLFDNCYINPFTIFNQFFYPNIKK